MSFTDPIADMITRIRNGQLRKLNTVSIPNSRFRARILDVLKDEGYISNYKILSEKQMISSEIVNTIRDVREEKIIKVLQWLLDNDKIKLTENKYSWIV